MDYNKESVYLPHSAKRYLINCYGEVTNHDGEIVTPVWDNGVRKVHLEWILGARLYEIGLIIVVTYQKLQLEPHLWDYVKPMYIDGDKLDCHPSNIAYRFTNEPLESENYPGFYIIPYFTRYAIKQDGTLVNVQTGKIKNWGKTKPNHKKNSKGGYHYTRIVNDYGRSVSGFRYRLLCLVFKDYEADVHNLVTNHIDGDPTNDHLDNLEWSSYRRNNNHALNTGLRTSIRPVLMKNTQTGDIQRFRSAAECGYHLDYSSGDPIKARIERTPQKLYSDNLVFKYEDDGQNWSQIQFDDQITRAAVGEPTLARNVFTGEITVFEGCSQGEALTGVNAGVIRRHLRNSELLPSKGFNFRYLYNGDPWPQHSRRCLEIYRTGNKYGIVCFDTKTREEIFYPNPYQAAQDFGVKRPSVFNRYIETPNLLLRSRYHVSLYNPLDVIWSA